MKKIKTLVVCKYPKNSKDSKICNLGIKEGFDIQYQWKDNLKPADLEKVDLVISIGGDGTALSAGHYIVHQKLLAVNANPKKSEGALTTLNIDELDKKLEQIISGNYKVEKLERIEVSINGKMQKPIALNEIFIANEKAYLVSKYILKIRKGNNLREEGHKSSGLIFSTGTGSTAWFKSAGGKPFSPQAKYVKMIVREPYLWRLSNFSITKEVVDEHEEVEVIPLTKTVLAIDSIREFCLKAGDKIKIKISKWPLIRIR